MLLNLTLEHRVKQLQVFPGLTFLHRIAQKIRRMVGGDHRKPFKLMNTIAKLGYWLLSG